MMRIFVRYDYEAMLFELLLQLGLFCDDDESLSE